MRSYSTRLTILLSLAATSAGAQLSPVAPARIDSIFSSLDATNPGCAVATMRNGAVDFARGYGIADLEHHAPITPQTAFYVASVSKQFTAAAVNLLVADGKLSLDDDVRKYFPELPTYQWPITIRHLMTHTSGLRDYLQLFLMADQSGYPIRNGDFLAMMVRQRALNFRPGDQYSYSNSNYVLMAMLVERVSGKSLRAFTTERFFKPLGMTSTVFRDRIQMLIPNRALAYAKEGDTWVHAIPPFDAVGDGGLFSTVSDLARWQAHMMDPRIGGPKWRDLMNLRGKLNDGTTIAYGAGLDHQTFRGETTVEHSGGYGGYFTYLIAFPRVKLSVAILCNGGSNAIAMSKRIASLYLPGADVSQAGVTVSSREKRSYTGRFFSDRLMAARDVQVDDGKLFYVRRPGDRSELIPLGDHRFRQADREQTIRFSGRDTLTFEAMPGTPAVTFRRIEPEAVDAKAYAGSYSSVELPARWVVRARGERVFIDRPRDGSMELANLYPDTFRWGITIFQFIRDSRGVVIALEVSDGERTRRVRFNRE